MSGWVCQRDERIASTRKTPSAPRTWRPGGVFLTYTEDVFRALLLACLAVSANPRRTKRDGIFCGAEIKGPRPLEFSRLEPCGGWHWCFASARRDT
jgi:hypothetical protein